MRAFRNLFKALRQKPSSYIAVILADGDKVGDEISRRAAQPDGEQRHRQLSACLGETAEPLKKAVEEEMMGKLVYAGGDDAVALAPAGTVIKGLGTLLANIAKVLPPEITVSVGVLIVPHTDPLSGAIREASRLLREEAKSRYNRAHIVIAARRQSGQTTQAVIPWRADGGESTLNAFQDILAAIDSKEVSPRFASRFGEVCSGLEGMKLNEVSTMAAYWMKRAMRSGLNEQRQADLFVSLRELAAAAPLKEPINRILLNNLLTMRFLTQMEVEA